VERYLTTSRKATINCLTRAVRLEIYPADFLNLNSLYPPVRQLFSGEIAAKSRTIIPPFSACLRLIKDQKDESTYRSRNTVRHCDPVRLQVSGFQAENA
jgi:hypothetical protein